MKKYIFLAVSALTLASCSSDDFLGDTPGSTPTSANSAIKFDGNAGKISRATSNEGTAEKMLDYQFKIYGVKSGENGKYSKVFGDYKIWYNTNKTTSNTNNWEYVAGAGTITTGNTEKPTEITLQNAQTIKYWDYASKDYHFVAGSPIENFKYNIDNNGDIQSATVSGLGGHINANKKTGTNYATEPTPVYVAEPVIVEQAAYKKEVKFNFVRQQTKVRVGIYETIPGYSISKINFYAYDNETKNLKVSDGNNIILTSGTDKYFSGGNKISGTITYNWTKNPIDYTFTYTGATQSKNWYGGEFAKGVEAIVSTETDKAKLYGTDADMESTGYFTVLPTPSATEAQPILIKCDYTLTSVDGSKETINVKGATAAIPAAYSKWNTNTLYTYIFKISDNTNGYTGSTDDPDHVGLYPITFDAAVKEQEFGTQGTITTFTTPSITTYQAGSVTNDGIEYKSGTPITVKVTNPTDGTDLALTETDNTVGKVAVYKLTQERTEADLQLASVTEKELISGNKQQIEFETGNKSFTFTPSATAATTTTTVKATNYYAIQYLTTAAVEGTSPAAYTYKVVKVVTPATATE